MGLFRKLILPYADDIMVKLMEHKDFPEEKYEIVIENKKLKEELLVSKSKHYDYLLEENQKMRNEIDKLREEKILRLEQENQMLKLELNRGSNNQLLIGDVVEEIIPLNITKFIYAGEIFKYFYEDGSVQTRLMNESKFLDIMKNIFPDGVLNLVGNELHISAYKDESFLGNLILNLTEYNRVSDVDDWIENKLSGIQYGNRGGYYDFFEKEIG